MAPPSKLTLAFYRHTHPARDLIKERSSKTFWALEQEKLVVAAALGGQDHTATKLGSTRDDTTNPEH